MKLEGKTAITNAKCVSLAGSRKKMSQEMFSSYMAE